ncbi:MAG: hypothetical protein J6T10_14745 [Methanobrevibacter sp.]|nr:hypothetical protein [Methanobrevibacter sp.]
MVNEDYLKGYANGMFDCSEIWKKTINDIFEQYKESGENISIQEIEDKIYEKMKGDVNI